MHFCGVVGQCTASLHKRKASGTLVSTVNSLLARHTYSGQALPVQLKGADVSVKFGHNQPATDVHLRGVHFRMVSALKWCLL